MAGGPLPAQCGHLLAQRPLFPSMASTQPVPLYLPLADGACRYRLARLRGGFAYRACVRRTAGPRRLTTCTPRRRLLQSGSCRTQLDQAVSALRGSTDCSLSYSRGARPTITASSILLSSRFATQLRQPLAYSHRHPLLSPCRAARRCMRRSMVRSFKLVPGTSGLPRHELLGLPLAGGHGRALTDGQWAHSGHWWYAHPVGHEPLQTAVRVPSLGP